MQSSTSSRVLKGLPAAPGMASGPALVWQKETLDLPRYTATNPEGEKDRLSQAVASAHAEIRAVSDGLRSEKHKEEAAVFEAHIMLLEDKSLHKKVRGLMEKGANAEAAWMDSVEAYAQQLEKLSDATLALRAADLRDIGERVLRILLGKSGHKGIHLTEPSIVLARDLAPSETVALDRGKVLGFCTAEGGTTSHTAILAKALGLPAIVSLGDEILKVETGQQLLVNGETGEVIVAPDEKALRAFQEQAERRMSRTQADLAEAGERAVTKDGQVIEVVANIGDLEGASKALLHGAEGVGLLRTEFLFLERKTSPSEEEQYQAYRQILDVMGQRPVVVRTIDVGGDKEIAYLDMGREANPFLGWRAIRLCLAQPELFKTQLRALVRASPGHDVRIMFPMISTLQEVRESRRLLEEAAGEVRERMPEPAPKIQVGIMVEIPSVAIQADLFAREVDFFSVGTNDLTQYSMAADRTNPRVANLLDHCTPAVIRQIDAASRAAHQQGIWIGVCGEMAGDLEAIPILLGLGVDELSMSPSLIPAAKSLIRRWRIDHAQAIAGQALGLDSAEAVRELVRQTEL